LPPKVFHDPAAPAGMSDGDKQVNRGLASWLFKEVLDDVPGRTLDIGCGYPYLAHCLKSFGCEAVAIDGDPQVDPALSVHPAKIDFERERIRCAPFRLVTLVHNFEHMYDPVEAMGRLRDVLADNGRIFLRLPDHQVPGFEAHLKPDIHPFFHCLDSLLEAAARAGGLRLMRSTRTDGAGQRDVVLRRSL
jgi:SAM-dependent methyltransferase